MVGSMVGGMDGIETIQWKLTMIGLDPHPAMKHYIVEMLVILATSPVPKARYMAAAHKLLPLANVILMQNDENEEIRAMIKARLEYRNARK